MHYDQDWHCEVQEELHRANKKIFIYRVVSPTEFEMIATEGDQTVIRTVDRNTRLIEVPTLNLPEEAFQALVDALKNRKPTEAKYTEGKLEATERHLDDMRTLLKLKPNGKENGV